MNDKISWEKASIINTFCRSKQFFASFDQDENEEKKRKKKFKNAKKNKKKYFSTKANQFSNNIF